VTDSGGGVKITINLGPDPRDARTIEAPVVESVVDEVDEVDDAVFSAY
jgi:hypothetical protein